MQTTQEERLLKHAYLYATFSEDDPQMGAVVVKDEAIISVGWTQRILDQPVSEIEIALLACHYSLQDSILVTPMPPCLRHAALICAAEISSVIYHKQMKDLLNGSQLHSVENGLKALKENDIEIIEFDGKLNCFTIKYQGKDFTP